MIPISSSDSGLAARESSHADRLSALFHAAIEAQRPREELLRLVLAASLPLAGGDLAVVCGPEGELIAVAPADDGNLDTARRLAIDACRALQRDEPLEGLYVSRLADAPPYVLGLRFGGGGQPNHAVAHAAAEACARLVARDADAVHPREVGIDALTELPARTATLHQLDDQLSLAKRTGDRVAVFYIDLDGFKAVNDTFGHAAGDRALVQAANRMREATRRGDHLGRLGGDEFLVTLNVHGDEAEMAEASERFLDRLQFIVEDDGMSREIGASIGVAVYPDDGTTAEALVAHADAAMYAAKRAGGRRACWYRDGIGQELHARREMRERLRSADVDRDFLLCYQPIVSAATLEVVGAEALVRWRHPSRGWLAPRTFMPAGVAIAVSAAIDAWVVANAASTLKQWNADGLDVRLHINLASADESAAADIERLVHGDHATASRLAVEISEGAALADPERVGAFMRRLQQLGVTVGIDAFGVSPTSLETLASLPLDFLKVDPRVSQRAAHDDRWERVARATIAVGRALGVRPLADGVESREQAMWLARNGIEELQGYFLAQPMTAPDFDGWLRFQSATKPTAL